MPAIGEGLSPRTRELCCIILLGLMPIAFLANVLFTDQVLVGDNLARDYPWTAYADEELLARPTNGRIDPLHQYYPHRVIAAEMVRAGHLPLWNPYFFSGTPFGRSMIRSLPSGMNPPSLRICLQRWRHLIRRSACRARGCLEIRAPPFSV